MNIYDITGKRPNDYTPADLTAVTSPPSTLRLYGGTIKKINIRNMKFGGKGDGLEGVIELPCLGRDLPFLITTMPLKDAPKHYEAFLDEMNCPKIMGYNLDYLKKQEVAVLWNGTTTRADGIISTVGLRGLSAAGRTFEH